MLKIGIPMAPQATANSYLKGKEIAQEFGFPLVIRASYTLGGAGASFVHRPGRAAPPVHHRRENKLT